MDRADLLPAGPGLELTPAEKHLVECAAKGERWTPQLPPDAAWDADPAKADTWPPECALRPDVIRCLLIGAPWAEGAKVWPVDPRGLMIRGAKILGPLDLEGCKAVTSVWMHDCAIADGLVLREGMFSTISLAGSRVNGIAASRAEIRGSLYLRDGFHATGEVNLAGAKIEGQLACSGGRFEVEPGKTALNGDALTVGADVFLATRDADKPFHATGEVNLVGAKIEGQLDCSGGRFEVEPGKTALDGNALIVGADVFLRDGFHAMGGVNLVRARIEGNLGCQGATFENANRTALCLDSARVEAGLYLAAIKSFVGMLDLERAHAGVFHDDGSAWLENGKCGPIVLDGFTYDRIAGIPAGGGRRRIEEAAWRRRLRWLRRQPEEHLTSDFRPQPWTQLIKVLRDMGYDYDARRIAIEREKTLAKSPLTRWHRRLWYWFIGRTVGYGYRPELALAWSLAFWLVGVLVFAGAAEYGFIAPRDGQVLVEVLEGNEPFVPDSYPRFNAFIYAADAYLPIIELGQDEAWTLSNTKDCRMRPKGQCVKSGAPILECLFEHGLHRVVFWALEVLGWIFVSLIIAGMSGLMKRE